MATNGLLLLLLIGTVSHVEGLSCPVGFLGPFKGERCFKVSAAEASWAEAMSYCKSVGGSLAVIDDADAQRLLQTNVISTNVARNYTFATGNDYIYHYLHDQGIDVTGHSSITFTVRACNDAHFALSKTKGVDKQDTYEIVIGGWADSFSVIRDCKQCPDKDTAHSARGHPLSCSQARPFWISWSDNYIRVGMGNDVGVHEYMHWNDTDPHDVNYIAVATGWGAHGNWTFERNTYMPGKFWVAGSDLAVEGEWKWLPSENSFQGGYTNWAPGEPDNSNKYQHCLVLDMRTSMQWRDDNCEEKRNFICEKAVSEK